MCTRRLPSPPNSFHPTWSRDGRFVVFYVLNTTSGKRDIWYLDLEGGGDAIPFLQYDFDESTPRLSPDGRFLAYQANEDEEHFHVYVRPFPEGGETTQVSGAEGGLSPQWSDRGDELFYVSSENRLMAVAVDLEPNFRLRAKPEALFSGDSVGSSLIAASVLKQLWFFDVHPDGERFAVVQNQSDVEVSIVLVQNWFEELKRLVPTD